MRTAHGVSLNLAGRVLLAIVRLNRQLRSQRDENALPLVQLSALKSLQQHGELTPRELAHRERIRPPTMTKLIAALEEAQLLSRVPHPGDRRQAILRLTQDGTDVLAAEASATEHWLTKRLDGLSRDERDALAEAIPIINRLSRS
jgi:DNA-binding MarR family transcriptional regulator